jgi:hypothetical protein
LQRDIHGLGEPRRILGIEQVAPMDCRRDDLFPRIIAGREQRRLDGRVRPLPVEQEPFFVSRVETGLGEKVRQ